MIAVSMFNLSHIDINNINILIDGNNVTDKAIITTTFLSIPKLNVITDSINGVGIAVFNDTLKALSTVRITGHIEDQNGQKLNVDFNF